LKEDILRKTSSVSAVIPKIDVELNMFWHAKEIEEAENIDDIDDFEESKFFNLFVVSYSPRLFVLSHNFGLLKNFNVNLILFKFLIKNILQVKTLDEAFTLDAMNVYIAIIFKTLQLKINYLEFLTFKNLYYTIGLILSYLKLFVSKSVRRNIKGIKILLTFFVKRMIKEHKNAISIVGIKGLSKFYLKIFYFLGDLFKHLNVQTVV
jgi:hypothetical protein